MRSNCSIVGVLLWFSNGMSHRLKTRSAVFLSAGPEALTCFICPRSVEHIPYMETLTIHLLYGIVVIAVVWLLLLLRCPATIEDNMGRERAIRVHFRAWSMLQVAVDR